MHIALRILIPLVLTSLAGSAAAADSVERPSIQIQWHPASGDKEGALWLAYLMARNLYITEHPGAYGWKPGPIRPTFPEELAARRTVVELYKDLKLKDAQLSAPYFEELSAVAEKGYLGEYVWTYLHQADWTSLPSDLRLVDFMHWRSKNLAQHVVATHGGVAFVAKGETAPGAGEPEPGEMPLLSQGNEVLQHGDPDLAIAGYFDPVIEHFEREFRNAGKRVYAARSQKQVLLYVALPHEDQRPVVVLDSTWSDAYLMKAYSLTELHQISDAQATLQKAIALSPLTSQYVAELGYSYGIQDQCERSIATYKQAESLADQASDDSTRTADLMRAWRGQGYCLTELGRFDEAETLYRKCLALDPADTKSKDELQYIAKKRK